MKRIIQPLSFIIVIALASSCTTHHSDAENIPPGEPMLPADNNRFVFVNFFDYRVPDFIKDRYEEAYRRSSKRDMLQDWQR
ncbi:MAG: hypothetical protein MZV63_38745 [Marinilabiliales bacterium]|nr:hypothetical protein [Marinilabiliales bacterium]